MNDNTKAADGDALSEVLLVGDNALSDALAHAIVSRVDADHERTVELLAGIVLRIAGLTGSCEQHLADATRAALQADDEQ